MARKNKSAKDYIRSRTNPEDRVKETATTRFEKDKTLSRRRNYKELKKTWEPTLPNN